MKYITLILILFLCGCATRKQITTVTPEIIQTQITREQVFAGEDRYHRQKAENLNISYVDYLHLVNSNKLQVNKSQIKYSHNLTEDK